MNAIWPILAAVVSAFAAVVLIKTGLRAIYSDDDQYQKAAHAVRHHMPIRRDGNGDCIVCIAVDKSTPEPEPNKREVKKAIRDLEKILRETS